MTIKIGQGSDPQNTYQAINLPQDGSEVKGKEEKKSLFAGDLKLGTDTKSRVEQKRDLARKQAAKLVEDAMARYTKGEEAIENMRSAKQKEVDKLYENQSIKGDLEKEKQNLREQYGVEEDSEEQKDLELLEKYQNNILGLESDKFSDDEISRLKELQNKPRTEYQNSVLKVNASMNMLDVEIDHSKQRLQWMTGSITDAELGQLKNRDVDKAKKAAEEIMNAADQEIMGLLIGEGKEHIDEEQEKAEEEAEEKKEKQLEQEERIQKARERLEELVEAREEMIQEEILKEDRKAGQLEADQLLQGKTIQNEVEFQKNIDRIIKDNHLVNDDLKGIEIDFSTL